MTIRNDATRLTIRAEDERHPRSVVGRQGQVLLDADLDQQSRHLLHRVETATDDMLGAGGRLVVPASSNAFSVTPAPTPDACGLGTGHGFQGGWLVENATKGCLLRTQPHPRTDTTPTAPVLLTLKTLVRYVDPVEEKAFADPALGDAQAAGRALIDWQVFPFAPAGGWGTDFGCATATTHPDWVKLAKPSSGTLAVVPDTAPPTTDPCSLMPQGGYSRPENLLFRIEVHGGVPRPDHPTADGPRFGMDGLTLKLSRRNASVLAGVVKVDGTDITVEPPALDLLNWFSAGAYAEFVSKHDDVDPRDAAARERLFQVARATDVVVTLETAAAGMAGSIKDNPAGWFLRLWDAFPEGNGVATAKPSAEDPQHSELLDLGDGLRIRLGQGGDDVFRRGDYWTFSARADGSVDWPPGREEPPHGPQIRYAPLAALTGPSTAQDCRVPAATLTDRTLLYRGGDGQEVPAPVGGGFVTLPGRLRVAVMRGRTPVAGASLTWSMPAGGVPSQVGGSAVSGAGAVTTTTDAQGLCEVAWAIDAGRTDKEHQVQAALTSATGTPEGPPLMFTAGFRTAAATSYQPGDCALLQQATTVQQALDVLCAHEGGPAEPLALRLTSIRLTDPRGTAVELVRDDFILNGLDVAYNAFAAGITLNAALGKDNVPLESTPQPRDPIVEVELDLPYPGTDYDKVYWARASRNQGKGITAPFGFHRVRLAGEVTVPHEPEPGLLWKPSNMASTFLATAPLHRWGQRVVDAEAVKASGWVSDETVPVLCRLRVRSAHVWVRDPETGRPVYLNAEHLGVSAGATRRELLVREPDPQRAADLDLFFYLNLDQ
ncbi:hypothetical protein ABB07_38715 [Streptomyces incarnatus]|uniref:Uncharacterized protein n=1 Tax=Streptomyces incarnatus TaxID=665007 RepID=A0ABM5TXA6_9ACTN|nr:DUF6519 domain-containing protein [Streptomyces incarnatus]AKJ15764.1 hypothetical protein ABB07_38715 [Streptomyces incarnatus]